MHAVTPRHVTIECCYTQLFMTVASDGNQLSLFRILNGVQNQCSRVTMAELTRTKGLIGRRQKSLREIMSAKYGWLHMGDSFEFPPCFSLSQSVE